MRSGDYLQDDIKDLGSDEISDNVMYKHGIKTVNYNIIDKKVCQLIFNYIYLAK